MPIAASKIAAPAKLRNTRIVDRKSAIEPDTISSERPGLRPTEHVRILILGQLLYVVLNPGGLLTDFDQQGHSRSRDLAPSVWADCVSTSM